jgi:alpha-N-arabinofuranosidase
VAPAFNEEIYNFEDALVLGGAMITLLNNCDRVKVACLAQLVNDIAPIMTETGGRAWKQPTFYPFADAARIGHGRVLRQAVEVPTFSTTSTKDAPYLLSTAVLSEDGQRLSMLVLNRHLEEDMSLELVTRGFDGSWRLVGATTLAHDDLMATNTADAPDTVAPRPAGPFEIAADAIRTELPRASWSVFTLERAGGGLS